MRRGLSEKFWYSLENSNILYTQFVVAGLKHTLYNYQSPLRTLRNTQVQRLPCVVKTPHGVTSPIMHPGECCERALWEGWWWMCVPGQAESMVTSLISCGHFLTRSPLCAVRCRKVIFTYHLSWAAPTVCTARCWAPYVYIYTTLFQVWELFLFLLKITCTCSAQSHMHYKGSRVSYQRFICAVIFRCYNCIRQNPQRPFPWPLRHSKLHCNHITWAGGK